MGTTQPGWEHLGDRFYSNAEWWAFDPPVTSQRLTTHFQSEETDMPASWSNQAAADLAREILQDKSKGELKDRVEQAVVHLQELISETECGATLTFVKTKDEGKKHYFYAAVKNGEKWYTTAANPRILENDDALITWLIGLEIWEAPQLDIRRNSYHAELASPIEATATES